MPIQQRIDCPACGAPLVRKPGGACPSCGADVRQHVQEEREKETRIDQVVAIVSTVLVVALFLFIGGFQLFQGVLAYALAGAAVWWFARRTFW
jgi:hypothetical protein